MKNELLPNRSRRLVFWGTYDTGKPRVRLLLAGARAAGFDVLECHQRVWDGVEDKTQVRRMSHGIILLTKWLAAYPSLIHRYLQLPDHDAVVVSYPGILDVLVLWPLTWLRGRPLIWDVFLSLYDTAVRDRRLIPSWSPPAWGLYWMEWLAARVTARMFLDTRAHASYFARLFRLESGRIAVIPVGAEDGFISGSGSSLDLRPRSESDVVTVLFYGQFIPLHGLDVIVDAAVLVARETSQIRWVLIGRGQESRRIDARLSMLKLSTVTRIDWVPYRELADWIGAADICLGIFGVSEKAHNVVPNKVYQALAMGRRIITSDTPAQRELLAQGAGHWLTLVPPGNARALADAVLRLGKERHLGGPPFIVGTTQVGKCLKQVVEEVISDRDSTRDALH
jgi:glycosyltransferase involved in cell wall biosynthesis